ncbi:helix-turn-helix domain-containing protein [Adlercreutzia caecimuris]|uniref:helix-turn-helix domain-containing protein n=1 Tax=Adlercreutzia caecimuris TaxID=671266 RepID=UPI002584F355|nr:helix-turn-helix domain-containing protein [Adlercreutzia caecimuris]
MNVSDCPDIMTPRHVAKLLGISEQTVRRQINLGEIPGFRIGRNLFVLKKHFLDLIDGGQSQSVR